MTSVVTGATGHVGGTLVRELLARGEPVRALVRQDQKAIEGLPVELARGDLRDPDSLCRAIAGADVVYHLAAHISLLRSEWPLLEAVNVIGTRSVVAACLSCGVRRLVHFSSIHALQQEPLEEALDESRPLVNSPRVPPYDRSKAAGELEVRRGMERGLDAVILYPTGIIGPYDFRPSFFGDVLLALAQGTMPAMVNAGFDWVDVRDVVGGALRAAADAPCGARYLLSGHWIAMHDLVAMVEEITGMPAPRFISPMWLARVGAPFFTAYAQLAGTRPLFTSVSLQALRGNRTISHEHATRDLGYQPRPFRNTLEDTLHWFAETGRLKRPVAFQAPHDE